MNELEKKEKENMKKKEELKNSSEVNDFVNQIVLVFCILLLITTVILHELSGEDPTN